MGRVKRDEQADWLGKLRPGEREIIEGTQHDDLPRRSKNAATLRMARGAQELLEQLDRIGEQVERNIETLEGHCEKD